MSSTDSNITNDIFRCRQIRASLDHEHKDLMTYMTNLNKVCSLFGYSGLRPHQVDPIYHLLKGNDLLFISSTGAGKCEDPDTEILMADMTVKKIKDIKIGDKVMSPSGAPRNVVGVHSGKDEMYKITYGLKRDKSFIVTADHKVPIVYRKWVKGKNANDIITVEAKELYKYTKQQLHQTAIPTCNCLNLPKQDVAIDPYILGVWLGDGTASRPSITTQDKVIADYWVNYSRSLNDEIRISIKKDNKAKAYHTIVDRNLHIKRSYLHTNLIGYNLINNKHIPNIYLYNDEATRLQLLAGLLDTDGYLHKKSGISGYYEIIQKSKVLADNIVLLATSLGFYVTRSIKTVKWRDGRILHYHRLKITGNDLERIPLKLDYKKYIKKESPKYDWSRHAYNVEKLGIGNYVGIQIDGPDHLYLHVDGSYSHNSFVYISVALAMGYKTVIFSPLISLIQNQADVLRQHGLNVGVLTGAVSGSEKKMAMDLWENKELDFLFVAPERLQNKQFLELMKKVPPDFIVVDEIHCAYEFAESFRASYKKIAPFVDEVSPKLFLGLTATMSEDVEQSVRRTFCLGATKKIVKDYPRPNLHYASVPYSSEDYNVELLHTLNQSPLVPTIVYFSTVKLVEETYRMLAKGIQGGCMAYTGKMANAARQSNQDNFLNGKIRVAFATNSFGMGVDKPDIGRVIFRTFPGSIEELVQGFGRGGRNGCDCDCLLMGDVNSLNTQQWFKQMQYPEKYMIEAFYRTLLRLKGDSDTVDSTLSNICNASGIDPMYSTAIINILKGYNVVDREDRNSIAHVRFLALPDPDDAKAKRYKEYYDLISLYGLEDENSIAIDLELLAEEVGVQVASIKNNLTSFAKAELIEYKAPGAMPLKIIGDIKNVDFDHIDFLRAQKDEKIKEVLDFYNMQDSLKADYLQYYFRKINKEQ